MGGQSNSNARQAVAKVSAANIVFLVVAVGSPFIVAIFHALRPGARRGRLVAERAHIYEGIDPARLRALIHARLESDRFQLPQGPDPLVLEARREAQRPAGSMMIAYPYPNLQLAVRVQFVPRAEGTEARFRVQSLSYAFRDTGEGEYLEAFLDFVMGKQVIRPVAPDIPGNIQTAPVMTAVALLMPWFAFLPSMDRNAVKDLLFWTIALGLGGMVMGAIGMVQIALSPTRYRGYWVGGIGFALGFLAIAAAVVVGIIRIG